MEIILIRHGKAEERRAGLVDIDRHLTAKGIEKFQKLMPEFLEKLEPIEDGTILLWSSPASRALETADIVAEALQGEIDTLYDFIYYDGDFQKLIAEVQGLADNVKVFVVGHEPILSDWAEDMTGEDFRIKKGEILSFQVIDRASLSANLQWRIIP